MVPEIVLRTSHPIDSSSVHRDSPYCWEDTTACDPTVMVIPYSIYQNEPDSLWHVWAKKGYVTIVGTDTLRFTIDTLYTLQAATEYAIVIQGLGVQTTNGTVFIDTVIAMTTVVPLPGIEGSNIDELVQCDDTLRVWWNIPLDSLDLDSLVVVYRITGYQQDSTGLYVAQLDTVDLIGYGLNPADSTELLIWSIGGWPAGEHYIVKILVDRITGESADIWEQDFTVRTSAWVKIRAGAVDSADSLPSYDEFRGMQYQIEVKQDSTVILVAPSWVGPWQFVRWRKIGDTVAYIWSDTLVIVGDCDQLEDLTVVAEYQEACRDTFQLVFSEGQQHYRVEVSGPWVEQIDSVRWTYPLAPNSRIIFEAQPDSGYVFERWQSTYAPLDSVAFRRIEIEATEIGRGCRTWEFEPRGDTDYPCDVTIYDVKIRIAVDNSYRKYRDSKGRILWFTREEQRLNLCSLYTAVDFVDIYVQGNKIEPDLTVCDPAYLEDSTRAWGSPDIPIRAEIKDPCLEISYWWASDGKRGGEPYSDPPQAWGSVIDSVFRAESPKCDVELYVYVRRKAMELTVEMEMQDSSEVRGEIWLYDVDDVKDSTRGWKDSVLWIGTKIVDSHYPVKWGHGPYAVDTLWRTEAYSWCNCEVTFPWRLSKRYVALCGDTIVAEPRVKLARQKYWWIPPDSLQGDDNDSLYANPKERIAQMQQQYFLVIPMTQHRRIRHQFAQPEFWLEWVGFPDKRYDTAGYYEEYYKIVRPDDIRDGQQRINFTNTARMLDEIPGTNRLLPPNGLKDLHLYYTHLRFKFNREVDEGSLARKVRVGLGNDSLSALSVEETENRKDRAVHDGEEKWVAVYNYVPNHNGLKILYGDIVDLYLYEADKPDSIRRYICHDQRFLIRLDSTIRSADSGFALKPIYGIYGATEHPGAAAWGIYAMYVPPSEDHDDGDNCGFSSNPDVYMWLFSGILRKRDSLLFQYDTLWKQNIVWWDPPIQDWVPNKQYPIPHPKRFIYVPEVREDFLVIAFGRIIDEGNAKAWEHVDTIAQNVIGILKALILSEELWISKLIGRLIDNVWRAFMEEVILCDDQIKGRFAIRSKYINKWEPYVDTDSGEKTNWSGKWHFYEGFDQLKDQRYPTMNFFYVRSNDIIWTFVFAIGDL